ncbi:MAG: MaoC family dehydratase [Acidimicrobiaceae bacterium]|nr:MaoC family dehydratase [Acidimicrobiaceae bacterium]MYC41681.1 MaoC family dehydratase [Acidimicrobiaceae bacterium]
MSNAANAYELLKAKEGFDEGHGDWFEITQEQINQFADCTIDHQFIHIDPERATPVFGGTIAHGFLTLSMLTYLTTSIDQDLPPLDGVMMGINYGCDRVRFLNPVMSGSRVRAGSVISKVELKGAAINTTRVITIEIEGVSKPALIAEWIGRIVFDS